MPIITDVAIRSDAANACNTNHALLNVGESTFLGTDNRFGEINLPTKPIVDGQLRGCSPNILTVIEHAMLAVGRVCARAHVAVYASGIPKQETSKCQPARTSIRGDAVSEVVNSRAVRVAGNTQVFGITNVGAELELMITVNLCPVGDKLELLLTLNQRTIAARNTQSIAERRPLAVVVPVEVKLAPTGRKLIT